MKIEINHSCANYTGYRAERVKSLFNADTGYTLEPIKGTLIFHPSPLPHGRGPSAIRWAYERKEPITAATWFWADNKLDGGDICEMEILAVNHSLKPRDYYVLHVIPALERTLERCLIGISKGFERRVPQVEEYSTHDYKFTHSQ